jgi:hypothetical protein
MEALQMFKTPFAVLFSKPLSMGAIAVAALALSAPTSKAEEKIQPPPYQMAGGNFVFVNVVWDEAAIRKALPPGIQPVSGMTGGINIYSVERGYVIGPYSAAYLYVDIEGFDSPEGVKGRWMLAGTYGPQPKTSAALKAYYGLPVRPGSSRSDATADGKRAVATVDGHDVIIAEIKSLPEPCEAGAISVNYESLSPATKQVSVLKIPFVGDVCKAEPVSLKITAPPGDPFSAFPIVKVVGVSDIRNGSFAFTVPQPARE